MSFYNYIEPIPYPEWLTESKRDNTIRQTEIQFFWPLTEQIPLDLDYTDCKKPKLTLDIPTSDGQVLCVLNGTPTWSTSIAPTLSVNPSNPVGQLNIGGVQIGMEEEPKWYQKVLYKLLGFNWKDKNGN